MTRCSFKRIIVLLVVLGAMVVLAPCIGAFTQTNLPPQVGTVPVYDGGKRAQWRGYLYGYDSWFKSNSRYRRAPSAGQVSPDRLFETESD